MLAGRLEYDGLGVQEQAIVRAEWAERMGLRRRALDLAEEFYDKVLEPTTHLEFVNADLIAAQRWPGTEVDHADDASELAAADRARRIAARTSFVTETVFSHESEVVLLADAEAAGYRVVLQVVVIPVGLAVARVEDRVVNGDHHVPEAKVRARFARLCSNVRDAIAIVDEARVYDNTRAAVPFRLIATFIRGGLIGSSQWPSWTPKELQAVRPPS